MLHAKPRRSPPELNSFSLFNEACFNCIGTWALLFHLIWEYKTLCWDLSIVRAPIIEATNRQTMVCVYTSKHKSLNIPEGVSCLTWQWSHRCHVVFTTKWGCLVRDVPCPSLLQKHLDWSCHWLLCQRGLRAGCVCVFQPCCWHLENCVGHKGLLCISWIPEVRGQLSNITIIKTF